MSMEPFFGGEVQFVTYADSSRGGPRITLRLHDRDALQAFIGMEGRRFMLALVEIGTDEQPVQPQPKATEPAPRQRMGPLCEWAVYRCGEPIFRDWVRMQFCCATDATLTAEQCGNVIKGLVEIKSRADLDTDKHAGEIFRAIVMQPFGKWLDKQKRSGEMTFLDPVEISR